MGITSGLSHSDSTENSSLVFGEGQQYARSFKPWKALSPAAIGLIHRPAAGESPANSLEMQNLRPMESEPGGGGVRHSTSCVSTSPAGVLYTLGWVTASPVVSGILPLHH